MYTYARHTNLWFRTCGVGRRNPGVNVWKSCFRMNTKIEAAVTDAMVTVTGSSDQ